MPKANADVTAKHTQRTRRFSTPPTKLFELGSPRNFVQYFNFDLRLLVSNYLNEYSDRDMMLSVVFQVVQVQRLAMASRYESPDYLVLEFYWRLED